MVAEIHGSPPNPASICDEEVAELREAMGHEKGLQNSIGSVERGECTEGHGCVREVGGVEIDAENLINASEACRRSRHAVDGGDKTMLILIPRWRAGEEKLNSNTENAHPAKSTCEYGSRARGGKDEHDERADCRGAEVADAVREPGKNVENGVLVRREDVGKVGTVQDVLERRENANPNVRSVLVGDEP